jgi:hypothetical protein
VNTDSAFYATGVSDIFSIAYSMSKLGYGNRPEMTELWKIIDSKKDSDGKVILEKTESKKTISMEQVGKPNKWITLYLLLTYKYKDNIIYQM